MKSLQIGTFARFRIAAAALFAITLLFSIPAMAIDSYDFGEVEIGSEAMVGLDIENRNPSSELTFTLLTASGDSNGFSLPVSEITIPPGGTAQVQVAFSPSAVGACEDKLQVYYRTFIAQEITLQGTGIEAVAAAPADLSPMAAAMQRWASAIASREYKGQTIGDRVQACMDSADNHGQVVRCVANLAAELRKERMISRRDAWEMRDYAVKSKHHWYKKARFEKNRERHHDRWSSKFQEKQEKHGRRWSNWD